MPGSYFLQRLQGDPSYVPQLLGARAFLAVAASFSVPVSTWPPHVSVLFSEATVVGFRATFLQHGLIHPYLDCVCIVTK